MKVISEEQKTVWDLVIEFEEDERERLLDIARRTMPTEELEDAMLDWCIQKSLLEMIERLGSDES